MYRCAEFVEEAIQTGRSVATASGVAADMVDQHEENQCKGRRDA